MLNHQIFQADITPMLLMHCMLQFNMFNLFFTARQIKHISAFIFGGSRRQMLCLFHNGTVLSVEYAHS